MLLQVGKLADLVMWKPSFFGAKPEMVIKAGTIAWANMGDPNASIPTPEPVKDNLLFTNLPCQTEAEFIHMQSNFKLLWLCDEGAHF